MRTSLLVSGLLYALLTTASAQTVGEITGEVKDTSGANLTNATVTATNVETNVARSTVSNTAGVYSIPGLTPGIYHVKATAASFQTVVKTNVELQVQQTARVDFMLAVGPSTQTVEVSGVAA